MRVKTWIHLAPDTQTLIFESKGVAIAFHDVHMNCALFGFYYLMAVNDYGTVLRTFNNTGLVRKTTTKYY